MGGGVDLSALKDGEPLADLEVTEPQHSNNSADSPIADPAQERDSASLSSAVRQTPTEEAPIGETPTEEAQIKEAPVRLNTPLLEAQGQREGGTSPGQKEGSTADLQQGLSSLSDARGRPLVALLWGPTGSGKSTLARALAGASQFPDAADVAAHDLLLPPSSHAHTRVHGMAFIEALEAPQHCPPPHVTVLDTPGILSLRGRAAFPPSAACPSPSPCSAALHSSPLEAAKDHPWPCLSSFAWQQDQAKQLLALWLHNGVAPGATVLLEPSPPLQHLLCNSSAASEPSLAVDCPVLVVSARDLLSQPQAGTSALGEILGVILLWSGGKYPPVALTHMESIDPAERETVRRCVFQALAPMPCAVELPSELTSAQGRAKLGDLVHLMLRFANSVSPQVMPHSRLSHQNLTLGRMTSGTLNEHQSVARPVVGCLLVSLVLGLLLIFGVACCLFRMAQEPNYHYHHR